ncbi:hypothetical protein BGX26_005918, partial [Mortierella sp. AD094]
MAVDTATAPPRSMHQHQPPLSSPIDRQSSVAARTPPEPLSASSPTQSRRLSQLYISNTTPRISGGATSDNFHRQHRSSHDSLPPSFNDRPDGSNHNVDLEDRLDRDVRSSSQPQLNTDSTHSKRPYSQQLSNEHRHLHGSDENLSHRQLVIDHHSSPQHNIPSPVPPPSSTLYHRIESERATPLDQRQESNRSDYRPSDNAVTDDEGGGAPASGNTRWNSSRDQGNMRHKFGTDMPMTIDLKSAIETCDVLCRFALHYAGQDIQGTHPDQIDERVPDPHHRANLQAIRNLNSTMLTGIQPSDRGGVGAAGDGESIAQDRDPQASGDATIADGYDDEDDDGPGPRFGEGPPTNEMVHELAKAATSIFQLAIRIKGWVGMTPEERELDEEINIIRTKRGLFMDGLTSMPLPTLDSLGSRADDWSTNQARGSFKGPRDSEAPGTTGDHVFKRPVLNGLNQRAHGEGEGEYSQFSTPFGSYMSNASSRIGMTGSLAEGSLIRSKSSVPDKGEPRQKY